MIDSDNYPKILFLYLTKLYIKNILIVLFIFLFLIYLIDFIELYRRASQKINFSVNAENNYIFTLVYMSFLKLRVKMILGQSFGMVIIFFRISLLFIQAKV